MEENPRSHEMSAFVVIGLAARTNNGREMSAEGGRIGPLWQAFYTDADARIPGLHSKAPVYSLYTNYTSESPGRLRCGDRTRGCRRFANS